ncbi:hypothetical protein BBI01_06725 [Chryseobacterium artocarpi]|uniref:Uncharacterized protein n=1 Tax=Chryseobacterium artocarpi TaxID=1414727 RepID=A0A1B8ZXR1_9FLAO|nr:hypothetical protein [Chryseobacterium artocarpi]OCA76381.1 hypothetical protein BBI01_06725 [Chryseobacterium artocarpi]
MKTIKIAVTALVIAGGTFSAFAFSANKDNKSEISKQTTLHWYQPTGSTPTFIRSNTIANEETASGCIQDLQGCERGYSSSQLNNPANPSSGVKPSEVANPIETLGPNPN